MIGWGLVAGAALLWAFFRLLHACQAASPADWGGPWRNRLAGSVTLFCRYYHGLRSTPLPLPTRGGAVVAANHVSGLDPLLLIAVSPRPLRFLIAREEYHRFGLNWLFRLAGCIPVDRQGRPERALREARRALEAGEVVAVFPHGKIHLDSDPPRKIKRGAVWLAQQSDCPIIPLRLAGIRAVGHTLPAVLVSSRARLTIFPTLHCARETPDDCLHRLARILDGKVEAPPAPPS